MMSTTAEKPATTPIPVQLSDREFTAFILPHLSLPKLPVTHNFRFRASWGMLRTPFLSYISKSNR